MRGAQSKVVKDRQGVLHSDLCAHGCRISRCFVVGRYPQAIAIIVSDGINPAGLALTCADSGCPSLHLLGPPGLASFWASTAAFTQRKQHRVTVSEVREEVVSLDSGEVVVEAVPLCRHPPGTDSLAPPPHLGEKRQASALDPEELSGTSSIRGGGGGSTTHVCYVCKTKTLPGRFDIQRARALGVPVGPMCAILKAGGEVTLGDGTVVRSAEVMGESERARFVAVICDVSGSEPGDEEEQDSLMQMLMNDSYWDRCECE